MSGGPPPVPGGGPGDDPGRERRPRPAGRAQRQARRPPRLPTRREPLYAREGIERQEEEEAPARTQEHAAPAAPPPRRRRRLRRSPATLALAGIAAIVCMWFLLSLFQPFAGSGHGSIEITIPRGSSVSSIASVLSKHGVISSSFFFQARATIEGDRGSLKPGTYILRDDMSYSAVLAALVKGPPPNVVTITVPEGRSRAEIARSLTSSSLRGDYLTATKSSPALDPRTYGATAATDLEGFLFPSTYQVKRGASVDALVTKQLQAFKRQFAKLDQSQARSASLTPYDVIVIASLIEREAQVASERPLVASVIYNRLRAGMPLGIDASVRFITGNWTQPLTQSQLATASPYNTRIHSGLPPGPIGNPGLASLEAAAHPASTQYLYFVANPCRPGTHSFATTEAEFNADSARYQAARARAGGRQPTGC